MQILKKLISLIATYRKTAAVLLVGVAGVLEAFGFTELGLETTRLFNAVCGVPAP